MELRRDQGRKGYEIREAKIPITITMRSLESLKPHEEVVQSELLQLSSSIQSDGVLRHPIIADIASGIVLDGTHRLLALKHLGYRVAPAALVDYQNPTITIERWYRTIEPINLSQAVTKLSDMGLHVKETEPAVAWRALDARTAIAVLQDNEHAVTFTSPTPVTGTMEMVRLGFRLESALRESGQKVNYMDSRPEALSDKTILLSMIKLTKHDVISTVMAGRLYPPKSTRHLIPSRPLGSKVPVEWLAMEDLNESQSRLMNHLRAMKLTKLKPGSTVGSRRYSEEVLLFA